MDEERQREIARKGGRSVPAESRSFSKDAALASSAGRKGGQSVPASERTFSKNPALAARAGRKGGQASGVARGRGSREAADTGASMHEAAKPAHEEPPRSGHGHPQPWPGDTGARPEPAPGMPAQREGRAGEDNGNPLETYEDIHKRERH
jgi:general stress protein YciG